MFDFKARVIIGWLARVFVSQPIRTHASKLNIFVFMIRWPTFLAASIVIIPLGKLDADIVYIYRYLYKRLEYFPSEIIFLQ